MSQEVKKVRLIRKTSRTFLGISFILMLLSTIALYFYVKILLRNEVEEELFSNTARVENAILKNGSALSLPPAIESEKVAFIGNTVLKDTLIFDPSQNEMEEFRELTSFKEINGKNYKITVRNLIVEFDDILIGIVLSYVTIILLVFIFLFYFNKAQNKSLWYPFFKNLEAMKKFSLSSETPISLVESEILEFSELNKEVTLLTNKVRSDYKNLKQYTEDVSHEIQTPLAIIQAKIENIINGDNLNDIQYEHLTSIQKDIQRLTQLNKRLALLTKIENQQFANPEILNLNEVAKKRINNFIEIYSFKIELVEQGKIKVQMDAYLADVLIDNLISNALKHSVNRESIKSEIGDNMLTVSNDGSQKLQNPEKLFSRFYREADHKISTGLGLAIIQKICDLYGFKPSYDFENGKHIFSIRFK